MDWELEARKRRQIKFEIPRFTKHNISKYDLDKLNSMETLPFEYMTKCDHCDNWLRLVMTEEYTKYGVNVYTIDDMGELRNK